MYYSILSLHPHFPRSLPLCPAPRKARFPGAEGGVPRWGTTRSSVPDRTPLGKGL